MARFKPIVFRLCWVPLSPHPAVHPTSPTTLNRVHIMKGLINTHVDIPAWLSRLPPHHPPSAPPWQFHRPEDVPSNNGTHPRKAQARPGRWTSGPRTLGPGSPKHVRRVGRGHCSPALWVLTQWRGVLAKGDQKRATESMGTIYFSSVVAISAINIYLFLS